VSGPFAELGGWLTSSRAGLTYLVLIAAALVLLALTKLASYSDPGSRIARAMEWAAITALGVVMVLIIAGEPFNE